jgi:hypothetical protein
MNFLFTGGVARKSNKLTSDWNDFKEGVMIIYDTDTNQILDEFRYITPGKHTSGENASVLFKACHIDDDIVYLTTKTEILVYSLSEKKLIKIITHELMNDVHHVLVHNNLIYVASTGIDSVLVFDKEFGVLKEVKYLYQGEFTDKFSYAVDYRKVDSLKPHNVHPNYLFQHNGDVYVTRFRQRDCCCLTNNKTYALAENYIHDGVEYDGEYYFTSVDGKVIRTDLNGNLHVVDLNVIEASDEPLGWCRSIQPLGHSKVVVGYSILRNTKFKENIKWAYSKLRGASRYTTNRTRACIYDIERNKLLETIYLDELGLDAVFSIKKL